MLNIKNYNISTNEQHPFHMVGVSPWPLMIFFSLLGLVLSFISYFHCIYLSNFFCNGYINLLSFFIVSEYIVNLLTWVTFYLCYKNKSEYTRVKSFLSYLPFKEKVLFLSLYIGVFIPNLIWIKNCAKSNLRLVLVFFFHSCILATMGIFPFTLILLWIHLSLGINSIIFAHFYETNIFFRLFLLKNAFGYNLDFADWFFSTYYGNMKRAGKTMLKVSAVPITAKAGFDMKRASETHQILYNHEIAMSKVPDDVLSNLTANDYITFRRELYQDAKAETFTPALDTAELATNAVSFIMDKM